MIPTLTPAYSRDYKSKDAALADFWANKDFRLNDFTSKWDGKYCNLEDLQTFGKYTKVKIRYNQLRQAVIVQLP